ncbi:NAD(P)-binding domain-containing protein [Psychroflexus sp. YR1-1]|uniref:NAD(P)-binding domain-containing protein n=1 Tax=Psychroflexus aurantiacus TaxID=2709310 RepID=A0A6B3QZT5_9FLAO|nr:NAD(P)/FAD-dependent oxidoreductase [Psychroflexus aurantiacus]NEV93786.1 NAD(P)-binding domain-containing protein [Psychroflexus aurantiacus]
MYDFIIIGAAQAGLSMAYELEQQKKNYIVLDKEKEIGASWLKRWDSLRLFTPSEFNNLKGMDFPKPRGHYPNKYEVADYFKAYVKNFEIPIRFDTLVTEIQDKTDYFVVKHEDGSFEARQVIVATGPFHIPYTPPFYKKIDASIFQIHSDYYKNPGQLQDGKAMVVGAGDSGYQILDEISDTPRDVYFSGDTEVKTLPQEFLGKTLWWWFTKTGYLSFGKDSWLGKKISESKQPVIGVDVKGILNKDNVIPVGKTVDAKQELIITEEVKLDDIKNIIWATGYRPKFDWIEGLELDKHGYPVHERGISNVEGLYFIGLPWLHTRASATLGGIKKDADYLGGFIKHKASNQEPIFV